MTADTAVARVTEWVDAYQAQGHAGGHELRVDDLRALLDIIEELCPDHVSCAECETALCETCGVGTPGDCPHFNLCTGCVHTACRDCAAEAHTADLGDEQRAYAKEAGL